MRRNTSNRGFLGIGALLLGTTLAACSPSAGPQAGADPVGTGRAQALSASADPLREAQAVRSLSTLAQVVTEENHERLGFRSVAEAGQAAADAPVAVYMVRLDQLRDFRPGQDAGQLLVDLESAVYPLRAGGEVRAVMELHKRAGQWEMSSIGNAPHGRLLDQARRQAAAAHGVAEDAFFEVRVPALNTYFLGHRGPQGLLLTPMLDDDALGLKAGQSRPAAEVFTLLQPRAQQHDGQAT